MGRMPPEVLMRELDLTWQSIFSWASWAIALVMIAVAARMGLKQRTPFYLFAVLAAGVAAFAEPLYDVAFDLWFYDVHDGQTGAMWSTFSAFGVVQPNWTHSGYIILYAAIALYAGRRMYEGRLTQKGVFLIWAGEIMTSIVFETIGTATHVYAYYGPYEMRIVNYPLPIGVLEGTQTLLFTVLAVNIWRRTNSALGLSSLFVAFPITMFGANFGLGSPLIIALHLDGGDFSSALVWVASFVTMGACLVAVRGAALFLPKPPAAVEPEAAQVTAPRATVDA
ncbi:MAG: hypothetical protein JWM64_2213 [Frankiales bacterium]|nr:hypothetical protein [Frankiales bacterium]